jgi:hypothetical protein
VLRCHEDSGKIAGLGGSDDHGSASALRRAGHGQ